MTLTTHQDSSLEINTSEKTLTTIFCKNTAVFYLGVLAATAITKANEMFYILSFGDGSGIALPAKSCEILQDIK